MNIKSNQKRARLTIMSLWLVLFLEIVSFVSGYFQYDLLNKFSLGVNVPEEVSAMNDAREVLVTVVYFVLRLLTGILFIMWFRRAYYNLHQLSSNLAFSEGWAAGSWFVPVLNFFRPFQIMQELYVKTKEMLEKQKMNFNYNSKILWVWWALWIVSNILGQLVFRFSTHLETLEDVITITKLGMVSNFIGIPLALLAIKVVKDYSIAEVKLMK